MSRFTNVCVTLKTPWKYEKRSTNKFLFINIWFQYYKKVGLVPFGFVCCLVLFLVCKSVNSVSVMINNRIKNVLMKYSRVYVIQLSNPLSSSLWPRSLYNSESIVREFNSYNRLPAAFWQFKQRTSQTETETQD